MKEKKNKIPSYRRKLFLLALAAVGAFAVGVTAAAVLHYMSLDNRLRTPKVEAHVEEDLSDGKKVKFTNAGTANIFIRAAWGESWRLDGSPGEILSNQCETRVEGTWVQAAEPQWQGVENKSESVSDEILWQDGGDGWWYYKRVLPPGEETEYILETVDFTNLEKLKEEDREKYKKASYDLHFTLEAVQASEDCQVSQDAVHALFGKRAAVKETENPDSWKIVWEDKKTEEITWDFSSEQTRKKGIRETGGEGTDE